MAEKLPMKHAQDYWSVQSYFPNWRLLGNAPVMIKYAGGEKFCD